MEELANTDWARAWRVAAAAGLALDRDALTELWDRVGTVQIRRDLNLAAAVKGRGELAKTLATVETRTAALVGSLEREGINERLGARISGDIALDQLMGALAQLALAASAERLLVEDAERARPGDDLASMGFGRPTETCYRELEALARSAGVNSEAGVIAFVQAIFREWGEAEPTADAVRSGIHRPGRTATQ
jgi:hypothetical protein